MTINLSRTSEGKAVKARYTPYFPRLPAALFFLPAGEYQLASSSRTFGPERQGELRVDVASGSRVAIPVRRTAQ